MADRLPTVWKCEKHTLAKHAILRRYLQAWFPILAKNSPKLVYVDGFAGPGVYEEGEPGSPLIALDVAEEAFQNVSKETVFLFVEKDRSRFQNLNSIIEKKESPFTIKVENAEFKDIIGSELEKLEKSGKRNAPIFFFIDPALLHE